MPSSDFHDPCDDEFGSSNLFHFSNSPDTLQGLEALGSNDQKHYLNPQELTSTGPFPDSPNGSFHDSSSESATSSKRTVSTDSSKTPPTTRESTLDTSPNIKMDWVDAQFATFADDDHPFNFGREADSSAMDGLYPFGEQDDSFMDRSFDFESASSSPDAQPGTDHVSIASPAMPTIKTDSSLKATSQSGNKTKTKTGNHKKRDSVSLSFAGSLSFTVF